MPVQYARLTRNWMRQIHTVWLLALRLGPKGNRGEKNQLYSLISKTWLRLTY